MKKIPDKDTAIAITSCYNDIYKSEQCNDCSFLWFCDIRNELLEYFNRIKEIDEKNEAKTIQEND